MKGSQVLVTVDPAFRTRGDAGTVWVDYPNIVRVVPVGGLIYIDDGLISLAVKKIGADAPRAPPSPLEPAPLPARPRSPRHPHSRAHLASAGRRFFHRRPPGAYAVRGPVPGRRNRADGDPDLPGAQRPVPSAVTLPWPRP